MSFKNLISLSAEQQAIRLYLSQFICCSSNAQLKAMGEAPALPWPLPKGMFRQRGADNVYRLRVMQTQMKREHAR
jgi:hypothetical protein